MNSYLAFVDAHYAVVSVVSLVVFVATLVASAYSTNTTKLRGLPFVFSAVVIVVPAAAVVGASLWTASQVASMRDSRVVAAVEAKYDVTVNVAASPRRLNVSEMWLIDGDAQTCMVDFDDIRRPDPVLVCDGVELGH